MSLPTSMNAVVIKGTTAVLKTDVPLPKLRDGNLLLKTMAVAGNPVDWKSVHLKFGSEGSIVGCDAVGQIVKLGSNVNSNEFHVGEYVYGYIHGAALLAPDNGAFAEYVALDSKLAFKANHDIKFSGKEFIPEGAVTTFEGAATIPCSWLTAGGSLFYHMGLDLEWEPKSPQKKFPVLVWGGSTALGYALIQLLKKFNASADIIVVASKKNELQLRANGATDVFDYHDSDVIKQITERYDNIQYLFDCVSTQETLNQVYRCADSKNDAIVLNYMDMDINSIGFEFKRANVKIDGNILYLALGSRVAFGEKVLQPNLPYRKVIIDFIKTVNPKLNNGELQHIPVKVYESGLRSTIQIMKDIQDGKNSGGIKLVATLN
ncbi:similar to Saccharomyces cerevisiae YLR460C Member of the quinone oxidoreductase family, up-regulated in response to the fungicide mancozeb [Maudiozyma saulgeensis]|uniref:Similar to Saccharomyces cerevisiae YLR460C Member of the quinone oxidoreductase family, up-regulated in response to the fungicide mancozeb n=1 Tax=Maudiozyma saulgeensis TaxID=1789683 RepID=A0A1X7RBB7_9SACH|nr:similar to Saccharomyces cerevisiae YLR460C Member of the quinone oxidoreductase family, up-regulated in response to the fungicide mancozeb [Kazachstania saulgeensis]